MQQRIYAVMQHQAASLGADMIAIGGIHDHVHLLLRFPATIALPTLVQRLKGASSHFVTHVARSPYAFKWQGVRRVHAHQARGAARPGVRPRPGGAPPAGTLYRERERTDESFTLLKPHP